MRLKSIEIRNYRSIVKTTRLELDPGLTVILGPNNEGKSNLLRAIVVAMKCLGAIRQLSAYSLRAKDPTLFRLPPGIFDWETDFPLAAQQSTPDGESTFALGFVLSNQEQKLFRTEIGSSINEHLPIEITVGARSFRFKVKKQGKGAKTYEAKTRRIASFVSGRFEFQHIPAIRPSELSLEVVQSLVDRELETLKMNAEYQEALRTIEALQKPVFDQLAVDVQTYLKKLLPSVKTVWIGAASTNGYRTRSRSPQFIVDDGTATELDAKGDGVKSLAAISLMRAAKAGGSVGDLVVAIEEPESHLHPEAIRQLAVVLMDMAKEHQVIITTHSPLLVARNRMEANIIVSNSKAVPAFSIRTVRESLGVRIEDNLQSAEYVILVEGETDIAILSALLCYLCPQFANLMREGRVAFDQLYGAGNVAYKVANLRLMVATPILILDDDKAGHECRKKAKTGVGMDDKCLFFCKRPRIPETELEDVINPDCYWSQIEQEFGAKLDRQAFEGSPGKWSDRMRAAFESGGKAWNSSIESNLKKTVAGCVQEKPTNASLPEMRSMLTSIGDAIVAIVKGGA